MNHLKTTQGLIFIKDAGGEIVIAADKIISVSPNSSFYGDRIKCAHITVVTGKSYSTQTPYHDFLAVYLMALKGQDSPEEVAP